MFVSFADCDEILFHRALPMTLALHCERVSIIRGEGEFNVGVSIILRGVDLSE